MGAWSLYFWFKLALHAAGAIHLEPAGNLALALLVWRPWPAGSWRCLQLAAAAAMALALWCTDAAGIAAWDAWGRLPELLQLDGRYLLALWWRSVDGPVAIAALGACAAYRLGGRALGWPPLVLLGLAGVALVDGWMSWRAPATAAPVSKGDAALFEPAYPPASADRFFEAEGLRRVRLPAAHDLPDLVFLSVCSLSWADLPARGHGPLPRLLARSDILFTRFNSASPYSGPSVLRLARATCGQPRQRELYDTPAGECLLFRGLAALGYELRLLLNHDGRFDAFAEQLERLGGLPAPSLPVLSGTVIGAQQAFDGSRVLPDRDLLNAWLHARAHAVPRQPQVLLYNTISLHDGNRGPAYEARQARLFDDLNGFIDQLEGARRPTVVVLVPEHGSGLHGRVGSGLHGVREVPTPDVTWVPVAVTLVGFDGWRHREAPRTVEAPASYFGLSALIADILVHRASPAGIEADLPLLPQTLWVAEREPFVYLHDGVHGTLAAPGRPDQPMDFPALVPRPFE